MKADDVIRKILVATDGSPGAERALKWAAGFAAAAGAKAVVATAILPDAATDDLEHARREGRAIADAGAAVFAAADVDHEVALLQGDPRLELATACAGDIDLVVIGTRGRGGFLGMGLGGVAHFLARRTACPLVAVPEPGGVLVGGTIVVGADASAANEPALRWSAATARQLDATLVAVSVHPLQADVISHTAANWQYRGEARVRDHLARVCGAADRVELVLAAGHPVEELMRVAAERDASMIVVGRRGRGGVHGLLLGRVPAQLLHHSRSPVVVVPH